MRDRDLNRGEKETSMGSIAKAPGTPQRRCCFRCGKLIRVSQMESCREVEEGKIACYKCDREMRYEAARAIVAKGTCPRCGAPLYRNNALPGWWQCEALPSPGFRHKGFENLPKCSFQIFTA
jgi:hypothetical protein